MKVLSFDVGIINLAYCLIDFKNEKEWEILNWGIINLTDRNKLKCEDCGKKPTFSHTNLNGDEKYYCKIHSKKVDVSIKNFQEYFLESNISDNICVKKVKDNNCTKKIKYCYNGESYCNSHAKALYKSMENKSKLKKVSKKSVGAMSIDVLRIKLIEELEKKPELLKANTVVIENQPTFKNPKMKAISSTVYDYYLIRGLFDKVKTQSNIQQVKYMSPSNKLKLADDGDTQKLIKLKGDDAKTYKLTKELGIKYCLQMIKGMDNWIELFNSYKKKDDLADAFLQGMYYCLY